VRGWEGPPGGMREALFHLRSREWFRDGAAYALSLALQPAVADWDWVALPPATSFLYYLLRPVRLAGKYGFRRLVPLLRRLRPRPVLAKEAPVGPLQEGHSHSCAIDNSPAGRPDLARRHPRG
jgi:hypothetical protein